MTLDGRGERVTTSYAVGRRSGLQRIGQVEMPHSLGLLYERVTEYLGFLHSSDEYKVMALASFGRPAFVRKLREVVTLTGRGGYTIAPLSLEEWFGPQRERGAAFEQRHYDIAHSLQVVLEETVLELATWLHRETGQSHLCMAGGVGLNCVMNSRVARDGPFEEVWVQPAAGDAGTALGAALWVDACERGEAGRSYEMSNAYLGPGFSEREIEEFLGWTNVPYRRLTDVADQTAALLAADQVIGWFQGRMEFGPRALGARSILASPVSPGMQARLNDIKDREDFRPVAPVVLEEKAKHWFRDARRSPYMLFVFDVLPEAADAIPAVRHVDGTARIQTVSREQNPLYHDLIVAFERRTGVPVLVNTSFNTRGEPIVCTPRQALESFWTSPLDALVIGPFVVEKRR
jgi:carbamoyltransferase